MVRDAYADARRHERDEFRVEWLRAAIGEAQVPLIGIAFHLLLPRASLLLLLGSGERDMLPIYGHNITFLAVATGKDRPPRWPALERNLAEREEDNRPAA
jgi:hypothetical protein